MGNLTVLAMQEPVQVDVRRLGEIVNELGESAAQTIICAAMEQLAAALAGAREAAMAGDMARLAERAELLSRLAWQVGLPGLAGVAVDVLACAERRDATGLAATLARMMRIGNRSLTEIWDGTLPSG
ncbi:hypothetical protein [Paracoccus sanguinis]|uniref:Hpt domain-containing protein n=1 Tax=Paracoccus sanguinis TaxID=1545044 RepID=A0A099GCP4_9RHOB|nr:hypothetical protein [Paracoccus sanguinis]KGJ15073.1 hypothetical protein IX54_03690 [Paracoccus sanguinis]KGJ18208.1 hypothetical protein IX57_05095 [Paracoccus sanguinis]KGJ20499.1 hypothetical protein IX55_05905 [Paracoccus sanguinis]KGJ22339.1 hypothetical protein IX56_08750 [Paracoccus sanguinis]QJD16760.1 hypothetical protein HGN31_07685 [Paracoccus sanguinis]